MYVANPRKHTGIQTKEIPIWVEATS